MSAALAKISEDFLALSEVRRTTKQAWAAYVRRRWPTNCQAHVEREWGLSAGRANGVVWSNITQKTIDQILDHKRGGPTVAIDVLALQFGEDVHAFLESVIADMRRGIADARARNEADDRRLVALSHRLGALRSVPRNVGARNRARLERDPDDRLGREAGRRD
jgi:hypothetical protein